jgi:hypothetical protein
MAFPAMKMHSNIPSASLENTASLTCLADSENYRKLDGKRRFLVGYWRALALFPFFVAIVIGLGLFPRVVPDTKFWAGVAETLIFGSLGWSLIFGVYALFVLISWFLVRCPKCGWRFGLGERCGSCDLPRSLENIDSTSL